MDELVTATGLRKGSLYAAFGDKRSMYLKALALYERTAIEQTSQLLASPGAPEKRISAFLDLAIDAVAVQKDRRGCFLCNASVDQGMLDPETERSVKASIRRLEWALDEALSELAANLMDGGQRRAGGATSVVGLFRIAHAGQGRSSRRSAQGLQARSASQYSAGWLKRTDFTPGSSIRLTAPVSGPPASSRSACHDRCGGCRPRHSPSGAAPRMASSRPGRRCGR